MKTKYKAKKGAWFVKVRGSYLPCSWQGLAIYFTYMAYIVALPIAWYFKGHDFWMLLTFVVPLALAAAIFTQFVAAHHSSAKR